MIGGACFNNQTRRLSTSTRRGSGRKQSSAFVLFFGGGFRLCLG